MTGWWWLKAWLSLAQVLVGIFLLIEAREHRDCDVIRRRRAQRKGSP